MRTELSEASQLLGGAVIYKGNTKLVNTMFMYSGSHQGTFGNDWRHFWLLLMAMCSRMELNIPQYTEQLLEQKIIWPKM